MLDGIGLMMVLFLNLSEPCDAHKVEETVLGGVTFQVLSFHCGQKGFAIWQRECRSPHGTRYWSRPFYLEELTSAQGFYMNRFGELLGGYHVKLDDTYIPECGT